MAAGYLIVTKFEILYEDALKRGRYDANPATDNPIYGIPHKSLGVSGVAKQYKGISRKPLESLSNEMADTLNKVSGFDSKIHKATEATNLLEVLEKKTGRDDGWVTEFDAIKRIWDLLGSEQSRYEIIFGKEYKDNTKPPQNSSLLGCDTAYFISDWFSCICDALFFPEWHGTDPEGKLFRKYFDLLNENGLFENNEMSLEYLNYYLSFDWTEKDDNFTSIEVYMTKI